MCEVFTNIIDNELIEKMKLTKEIHFFIQSEFNQTDKMLPQEVKDKVQILTFENIDNFYEFQELFICYPKIRCVCIDSHEFDDEIIFNLDSFSVYFPNTTRLELIDVKCDFRKMNETKITDLFLQNIGNLDLSLISNITHLVLINVDLLNIESLINSKLTYLECYDMFINLEELLICPSLQIVEVSDVSGDSNFSMTEIKNEFKSKNISLSFIFD